MSSAAEQDQLNEESAKKLILVLRIEALRYVLQADSSAGRAGPESRHRTYIQNEIQDAVAGAALSDLADREGTCLFYTTVSAYDPEGEP